MSFNQPCKNSPIYSQDFTLAAGTVATTIGGAGAGAGAIPQRFTPQCSKIIGIVGKTLNGVPAFQNVAVSVLGTGISAANIAAGVCPITLLSGNAADASIYTVYWYNAVGLNLLSC
jgi:hypothetical protein